MENKYRHLRCGLTEIVSYYHGEKKLIYIDTKNFEKVNAFKGMWRVHFPEGRFSIVTKESGRWDRSPKHQMSRVIKGVNHNKIVIIVNGDAFDLREENLLVITTGTTQLPETRAQVEKMLSEQRSLSSVLRMGCQNENEKGDDEGMKWFSSKKEKHEAEKIMEEAKQSIAATIEEEDVIEGERSSEKIKFYVELPSGNLVLKKDNEEIDTKIHYKDFAQAFNALEVK